jgi:uncharacterized protein
MFITINALAMIMLLVCNHATTNSKHPKPNRLKQEFSPYLRQHAENPVEWYPWCEEAFDRARRENKLVFLSIVYSTCHWCHVMEVQSFSNPDIAKILNQYFVCIKVDREERPDIDEIYMTALQLSGNTAGWPLSMFLTPSGKPIFGGTYWPPDDVLLDGQKLPGFRTVLLRVIELLKTDREGLFRQADSLASQTKDELEHAPRVVMTQPIDQLISAAIDAFEIDPVHGGLGNKGKAFQGPKFPRPVAWRLLHEASYSSTHEHLKPGVKKTLHQIAMVGLRDHVGGGFHRYSTNRSWTAPHFEKMLYDQAQLVELYTEAYVRDPQPFYRHVIEETLRFVSREMTSPEGYFYSAIDADSDGKEGAYYVWTQQQLLDALATEQNREIFDRYFLLHTMKGNADQSIIIAKARTEFSEADENPILLIKNALRASREKRKKPACDTKSITAWNALMIAAYARAGSVLKTPEYISQAATAAKLVLKNLRDQEGRLLRIRIKSASDAEKVYGQAYTRPPKIASGLNMQLQS